jgi:hypothetical protein
MNFNPLAVLVAAISSFVLGGLWYSRVLFGPAWGRAAGVSMDQPQTGPKHAVSVFGVSFVCALIAAVALATNLGPAPPLRLAVMQGLVIGACFVAACFGINYQFANRSAILWLIDGGYHIVQFVLYGVILGLWH